MAEIKAFRALRFTEKAGAASELTCPPYDIVSDSERLAYLAKNKNNIIRLELPREGESPYKQAGNTLSDWLDDGILACDGEETLYIYEEEFTVEGQKKRLKGLMARVRLEPFEKGVILPHEETLSKAKDDRFNLMLTTGCNFSSVYSLYFDDEREASKKIDSLSSGIADMEFTGVDGIIHRVWNVTEKSEIDALESFFSSRKLYIADGHHRYETGLRYRRHLEENGMDVIGDHPANYILMTLVSMEHDGLVVLPTHRIVGGLEGFNADKLLSGCAEYFDIEDIPAADTQSRLTLAAAQGKKTLAFYHGKMKLLTLKDLSVMDKALPDMSEAYRMLDVTILHTLILERLLGIGGESLADQKNLTYTRDIAEAISSVDNGEAACAFLLNPTLVEEIAAVAGAGEKMPQKSTYFYPKLITGHVMNRIL